MCYRDQEMRFTVHDSPDYYQLKVSVFNDDKKTELIGETWIALEQIVKPGGGKNDLWHHLICKGRFAGEIRIELTYYDIRPREEKSEERRQSAPIDASIVQGNSGIGGPRQPKPVKRRPLPADPTDPTRSISLPHIPSSNTQQQRYVESPDNYGLENTQPRDRHQERLQNGPPQAPLVAGSQQPPVSGNIVMPMVPPAQQLAQSHFDVHDPAEWNNYSEEDVRTQSQDLQNGYPHEQFAGYHPEHAEEWQPRPLTQPLQTSQGMIHSHSMPALIDARPRQPSPQAHVYPGESPPEGYLFEESHGYQISRRDEDGAYPNRNMAPTNDEDLPPPPPPVHRNSGSRLATQSQGRGQPNTYAPIPTTAPLNIHNGRGSITGSPLSQIHSNPSLYAADSPSATLSKSYSYSQAAPSQSSYSQLRNQRSLSPMREFDQAMPPSLVPGYEPSIAEDESERIMHENRMSAQHYHSDPPRNQPQQAPEPNDPSRPQYQQKPALIEQARPPYQQAPLPAPQLRPQPRPRDIENVHDRRAHRSSAPIIQPQKPSPDPRTPVRKSLSPSPGSAPAERRHLGIPFSPDSFDAFNPSMSAANGVNEPGARYNTPEQAKEATLLHQRQEKLGDGPIIGNDGRIIDPSDHLPTDTWAPEPEQKTPKKGPQVTMRFRHSPQGAQPMPAARRPVVEHTMSTPLYTATAGNPSPSSAGRIRLQKKSPAATGQPASSPHVPTLNTMPRSSPLRTSGLNSPLRERGNYGGYDSSPTYGRPSPGNIPPPIPGKVPIGGGQEDWDTSALSEEMRRIDIGVGGGQGRQRRSGFGV